MIELLAQQMPVPAPSAGTWDVVVQQVPALLLFVAFAYIVFKYLEGKESRHKTTIESIVATWTKTLEAHEASFLQAMKEGADRNREERELRDAAAREIAKECHARQGESIAAMRDMAVAVEKVSTATEKIETVAGRIDRLVEGLSNRGIGQPARG